MSVSTWAPARQITDDAVHILPDVPVAPAGRVAVVRQRGRGGVGARERFSGAPRPALRLVPPLPAVANRTTGATLRPDRDLVNESEYQPTGASLWPDRDLVDDSEAEPISAAGQRLDSGVARASVGAVRSDPPLARASIPIKRSDRSSAAVLPARSASSSSRTRSAHAPVRLTRRGRRVLAGLLLVFATAMVGTLASTVEAAAPSSPPRAVVVHPGDTLWSIASRVHPRGSLTDTMLAIERLNHMPDGTVYVGQQLLVPSS